MPRLFTAFTVCFALLALAGLGYVIASNRPVPDASRSHVEFDRLRGLLVDLEQRLESLASDQAARSTPADGSAPASGDAELADPESSRIAESELLARLDTMETRLRGLEADPAQRAFTYLQSENAELRKRGVYTLEALASSNPDARAALREMLTDSDPGVCKAALDTLADLGDESVIPYAVSLLDDQDAGVRREAINTLTRLGTKDAASEIAPFIADENDEVRRLAVDSMGKLRYKDSAAALTSALEDSNLGVRGEAISSLGEIGATESLPRLRELYADQTEEGAHRDADHRIQLAMAMKQLGDGSATQAEIARLGRHIHYENNGGAMKALMWIGRDEPAAMEVFAKAAEVSSTEWIRREARRMLEENKKAQGE